jgi:hypothetical protein
MKRSNSPKCWRSEILVISFLLGYAFPENQLAELLKEGPWRIENPPFDLLRPLSVGQCCQFLLGIFKGWAILS